MNNFRKISKMFGIKVQVRSKECAVNLRIVNLIVQLSTKIVQRL